jgi:outer membrane receptor for ferrienterochelin and colicins
MKHASKALLKTVWMVVLLLLRPHAAPTSQDSTQRELDQMVVTATRSAQSIDALSSSVDIIDRTTIELAPAKNLDDLLQSRTGLGVRRSAGIGEGVPADISIRGIPGALAAARVLILVDGLPTNTSGTPFLILNEIPVAAIERVEIVHGPFSSLYGANAFSGVINVITRKPTKPLELSVAADMLPPAYGDATLWAGVASEKLSVTLAGGIRGIDNYSRQDSMLDRRSDSTWHLPAQNYDYQDQRALARLSWQLGSRATLELQGRYFASELGQGVTGPFKSIPGFATDTLARVDVTIAGSKLLIGPKITLYPSDNLILSLGGFVRRLRGEFARDMYVDSLKLTRPTSWESTADDGQLELQGQWLLGESILTFGTDALVNRMEFGAFRDRQTNQPYGAAQRHRAWNSGVFVQGEIGAGSKIRITPGLRLDINSQAGTILSPKLGLSYTIVKPLHLRLSAGRAFRAPSMTELELPDLPINASLDMVSNPLLKPEYIWAFDGGIDVKPARWLDVTVNGFYNDMKGLVAPVFVASKSGIRLNITHRNISSAWSSGVELAVRMRPLPGLSLNSGYSLTTSLDTELDAPLDYLPRHKVDLNMLYQRSFGPAQLSSSLATSLIGERNSRNWLTPDIMDIQPLPRGNEHIYGYSEEFVGKKFT